MQTDTHRLKLHFNKLDLQKNKCWSIKSLEVSQPTFQSRNYDMQTENPPTAPPKTNTIHMTTAILKDP